MCIANALTNSIYTNKSLIQLVHCKHIANYFLMRIGLAPSAMAMTLLTPINNRRTRNAGPLHMYLADWRDEGIDLGMRTTQTPSWPHPVPTIRRPFPFLICSAQWHSMSVAVSLSRKRVRLSSLQNTAEPRRVDREVHSGGRIYDTTPSESQRDKPSQADGGSTREPLPSVLLVALSAKKEAIKTTSRTYQDTRDEELNKKWDESADQVCVHDYVKV